MKSRNAKVKKRTMIVIAKEFETISASPGGSSTDFLYIGKDGGGPLLDILVMDEGGNRNS